MKKILLVTLIVAILSSISMAATTAATAPVVIDETEQFSPAREKQAAELTKFLGSKWTLDTKDVFCATINPLSCHDRLQFLIKAGSFGPEELNQIKWLWNKWGRSRELKTLKNQNYVLTEVALLFGFTREKDAPDMLEIVFYYKSRERGGWDILNIHNSNTEWYPTIIACIALSTDENGTRTDCNHEPGQDIYSSLKVVDTSSDR